MVGTSKSTCHDILCEGLGKTKTECHIGNRILTDQKDVCSSTYSAVESFCFKMIAGDETWCLQYYPQLKQQSTEWRDTHLSLTKKAHMQSLRAKMTLIAIFGLQRYSPPGVCTSGSNGQSRPLQESVTTFTLHYLLQSSPVMGILNLFLLIDNARPHTALSVQQFLACHQITVLPHAPYSPDLSPCVFYLFHKTKQALKEHLLANIESTQAAITQQLAYILESAGHKCFQNLEKRWKLCSFRWALF